MLERKFSIRRNNLNWLLVPAPFVYREIQCLLKEKQGKKAIGLVGYMTARNKLSNLPVDTERDVKSLMTMVAVLLPTGTKFSSFSLI